MKLTQLELAELAEAAAPAEGRMTPQGNLGELRARRVGAWESRIGAWERGIDAPSATYIPTLARVLGVAPLSLFEIDPERPTFTALRLAAGLTLQALAAASAVPYTSLHRMARGLARVPDDVAEQLASILGVTAMDLREAIARER